MRGNRIKIRGRLAVYHCISRTVNGEFLFDEESKGVLRNILFRGAAFSGVQILTYCVMSNHFHVLVAVPDKERIIVSDAEIVRRHGALYGAESLQTRRLQVCLQEGGELAAAESDRWVSRMHDVSEFIKTVKSRFTIWYNTRHKRFGTLWSERFKSVLVEGRGNAVLAVALYIDLNPVRAGLVDEAADYPQSGLGEASQGRRAALEGIAEVLRTSGVPSASLADAVRWYRDQASGKARTGQKKHGETDSGVSDHEDDPTRRPLMERRSEFSTGIAVGSKDFVESVQGPRQKRGKGASSSREPSPLDDWF